MTWFFLDQSDLNQGTFQNPDQGRNKTRHDQQHPCVLCGENHRLSNQTGKPNDPGCKQTFPLPKPEPDSLRERVQLVWKGWVMVKCEKEKMLKIVPNENRFFAEVATILQEGRGKTRISVNAMMIETYWKIGRRIVEQEQKGKKRAEYGEYLIVNLSRYLGEKFGKGFSVANLKNFRRFYTVFPALEALATQCVANLSWSHIRLIIRLESQDERSYYLKEASEHNWNVRLLERNIQSGYYRRRLSTQTPMSAERAAVPHLADFIKNPYVLEFLGLPEDGSAKESSVESAIITHLQEFLLEMGRGFSFVGRQFRISTETSHFYIDLVFYNYLLKCFVVIDLKTSRLTHQDIGQMDMYVRMFDDLKRDADDNPTIGIILCADKDDAVAKYSVLSESNQIFASRYKLILPTEEELAAELERNACYLREVRDGMD